ncbi:zinc ribbon domain-containing protein [Streptomyces sp. NPDC051322]|uniref:NADase-type glycan-binding domain-containing protein n=1 Tax=Streptomyces sp. NPDC051322 TaxID=3154645 RepID=UPI0034501D2D
MTTETPGAEPGRRIPQASACAECGTPAVPGHSFCDGCGAVLRWSPGGRTAAAAEPAAAVTPGGAAASGGAPDGSAGSPHAPAAGAPVPAGPAPADGPPRGPEWSGSPAGYDRGAEDDTEPLPPVTDGGRAPDPGRSPDPGLAPDPGRIPVVDPAPDVERERARALLVPVADPEQRAPEAPSVAPVLPGRPVAARPQVQQPGQEPDDGGGAPCPWCGTGNRPDRHFCRRCGMTMAGRPADPARLPWWRRLGIGNRAVPWAGERPRLRRGLGRVLTWVAGAAALALVIVAAFQVGPASHAVRDHFSKRAPVAPDSERASRSFGGHGADKAFDKFNNTWWGPGVTESGDGEWVEARFLQPTRLLDVVITSGISTQPSDLSKAALPHRIEARITNADGHTTTRYLTLDQASGPQTRSFRVGAATAVRFIIRSAYGASSKNQVSIAEIELFGRSSASNS